MKSARDRISDVVQKWFLVEPLLFAVWTSHELSVNPFIRTIRVGFGRIEYNPEFIDELDARTLRHVLEFEALRIVLKHPYQRRQDRPTLHYAASNLALHEHVNSELPFPTAAACFGHHEWDKQYLEFYYAKLVELLDQYPSLAVAIERASGGGSADGVPVGAADDEVSAYTDADAVGQENTADWEEDELVQDQINDRIRSAEELATWGTIAGRMREAILATLRPKLNYRAVLRMFRASVLSIHRRLTRMKPNRRYGFQHLGSRYDFTTRLLFAVDVSGSMSTEDIQRGVSIVNQLFKYGISSIDVLRFDTEIQGELLSLRRARHELTVEGRGGTSFAPVLQYLDAHPGYDGLIIFTDGMAPVPAPPTTRRTRLLWLFHSKHAFESQYPQLRRLGLGTFLNDV